MDTIRLIPSKLPIHGSVQIGGSKSYTNRALIMAALARGKSRLTLLSLSNDSKVLIQALQQLGVHINVIDENTIEVEGNGGIIENKALSIDIGHAGTAMRFLTALSCLVPGTITLDGSARMRERPIKDLVVALRHLGAQIVYKNNEGFPPLTIHGNTLSLSTVSISGKISSQYITALLLIAPALKSGIEIAILDEQISKSYIDMTIDSMKSFGIQVVNDNYKKYSINSSQKYKAIEYQVEGDASGASYLFGLAAVTGGTVTVTNLNPTSAQGDVHFVDILKQMGCLVIKNQENQSITVIGPKKLKSVSVDMSMMPDTAQTLAVIAAFANGKTHITGLSTLKVKETDRLEATKNELLKMGINCVTTNDSITITGGAPHGAEIETYKDHRMALSFSIAGAMVEDIHIKDPGVVAKSFPNYWKVLSLLGIKSQSI
jgi:3-phosphoshikimate 1-carboxyvinyltransferase